MRVDVRPNKMRREEFGGWIWRSSARGASFCQVAKISPVVRSKP